MQQVKLMPSNVRFKEFKRMFKKYGVVFTPGSKHWNMSRIIDGYEYSYTIPTVSGREVKHCYIDKARKAMKLDRVSDEVFFS